MCMICFIDDRNQYLLRHSAKVRTDRFEHSLEMYKKEFIIELKKSFESPTCDKHKRLKINENITSVIREKIDITEVEEFFCNIKKTYMYWIDANIEEAISLMKELVNKIDKRVCDKELKDELLFRGRFSKEFISHWDMFHIPFNRRFLITNQRYSLVGQPILYFATSPYGVYKEVGGEKNLKIARFRISGAEPFNIFENINKFSEYISINEEKTDNDKVLDQMLNTEEINNEEIIKSMFYLMILSSCCSFSRGNHNVEREEFAEEYILPQILTIVLKKIGYQGIRYISTKVYIDNVIKTNNDLEMKIKNMLYNNYCLFTNYSLKDSEKKTNVYDRELYSRFDISNVVQYGCCLEKELLEIDKLYNSISNIDELQENANNNIIYILKHDLDKIKKLSLELDKKHDNTIIKNFINMHTLFIRDILLELE